MDLLRGVEKKHNYETSEMIREKQNDLSMSNRKPKSDMKEYIYDYSRIENDQSQPTDVNDISFSVNHYVPVVSVLYLQDITRNRISGH